MLEELYANYRALVSKSDWDEIVQGMKVRTLNKGEVFIQPNDSSRIFALVSDGVARHYYVDKHGREWTKIFAGPGDILGVYAELLQNRPARSFVEAITPMKIVQGGEREFQLLEKPVWDKVWRLIAQEFLMKKEAREFQFLRLDAQARYIYYKKKFAHLDNVIPRKHVASYLRITPQSLSRLTTAGI